MDGWFDPELSGQAWFDPLVLPDGWFDPELVAEPAGPTGIPDVVMAPMVPA